MIPQASSHAEDQSEETTNNILNDNVNIGTIKSCIGKIENSENSSVQELADCCRELADLSRELINRDAIREVDGIPSICKLLQKHSQVLEESKSVLYFQLCRLLGNLCFEHSVNALIICEEENHGVPVVTFTCKFVDFALQTNDSNLGKSACACLANFSHSDDSIRRKVVTAGGVKSLLSLVYKYKDNQEPGMLYHSLRALENVCDVEEACEAVIHLKIDSKNALDVIIDDILDNPSCEGNILSVAIKIVGLIGSHKEFNDLTIEHNNLITALDNIMMRYIEISETMDGSDQEEEESVQEIITHVIHLLDVSLVKVNNKWAELLLKESKNFTSTLKKFVHTHTQLPAFKQRIQENVVEFLSNVAEIDYMQYYMATELDLIQPMVELIKSILQNLKVTSSSKLLRFIVKLLGFLALEDRNIPIMIENHVVEAFTDILSTLFQNQLKEEYQEASPIVVQMNVFIQRNCCIALGNIGRTDASCKYIVSNGTTAPLVEMLSYFANSEESEVDASHFVICFYSLDALANLIHNNDENATLVLTKYPNLVSALVEVMKSRKDKVKVSFAVLKCLFCLFKQGKIAPHALSQDQELMSIIQEMETSTEDEKIGKLVNEVKQAGFF
ncbi:hypothetical protein C9374_007174 [Naegleria lovaniensis]|uniref:Uncharacterized protein n=1 Tax=Naegleria lovaniensis TaxID=51637 RepID=A0AA88H330_NAELO|nr:uncharacterized protein C9374_007174 [Naegleria lovaniensis]KAG2393643.1 hypothetical protein C9374_007174 [Naegleria lovaniensis]